MKQAHGFDVIGWRRGTFVVVVVVVVVVVDELLG
jgi:hypothetical protein